MTKTLCLLTKSSQPKFRQQIIDLEQKSNSPANDIHFTLQLNKSSKDKIALLNLDPSNLEGPELYYALIEKVRVNDLALYKKLRYISAKQVSLEANLVDGIALTLSMVSSKDRVYAVKSSYIRQFINQNPPRKTLKSLGFRSIKSVLKNENLAIVLSVAVNCESKICLISIINI